MTLGALFNEQFDSMPTCLGKCQSFIRLTKMGQFWYFYRTAAQNTLRKCEEKRGLFEEEKNNTLRVCQCKCLNVCG